jgi:hypothetical protein
VSAQTRKDNKKEVHVKNLVRVVRACVLGARKAACFQRWATNDVGYLRLVSAYHLDVFDRMYVLYLIISTSLDGPGMLSSSPRSSS